MQLAGVQVYQLFYLTQPPMCHTPAAHKSSQRSRLGLESSKFLTEGQREEFERCRPPSIQIKDITYSCILGSVGQSVTSTWPVQETNRVIPWPLLEEMLLDCGFVCAGWCHRLDLWFSHFLFYSVVHTFHILSLSVFTPFSCSSVFHYSITPVYIMVWGNTRFWLAAGCPL